jgi:CrcB protein
VQIALIALGGAIGAVCRYGLSLWVAQITSHALPYGTAVVNLSGCFVFGILAGWSEYRAPLSDEARAFLLVGVLGGFTTFSSFGYETFLLLREGRVAVAALNGAGQLITGLVAVWAGWMLFRALP